MKLPNYERFDLSLLENKLSKVLLPNDKDIPLIEQKIIKMKIDINQFYSTVIELKAFVFFREVFLDLHIIPETFDSTPDFSCNNFFVEVSSMHKSNSWINQISYEMHKISPRFRFNLKPFQALPIIKDAAEAEKIKRLLIPAIEENKDTKGLIEIYRCDERRIVCELVDFDSQRVEGSGSETLKVLLHESIKNKIRSHKDGKITLKNGLSLDTYHPNILWSDLSLNLDASTILQSRSDFPELDNVLNCHSIPKHIDAQIIAVSSIIDLYNDFKHVKHSIGFDYFEPIFIIYINSTSTHKDIIETNINKMFSHNSIFYSETNWEDIDQKIVY